MHSNLIQNKATCLSFHSNNLRLPNSIYRIYDRFLTITCIQIFLLTILNSFPVNSQSMLKWAYLNTKFNMQILDMSNTNLKAFNSGTRIFGKRI